MKQSKSTPEESRGSHSTNSLKKYKVICTDVFLEQALKMKKKYPNIKSDFLLLKDILKKDPISGNDALGAEVYKVRMAISDKNKGQSAGARVFIQVKVIDRVVYVLHVIDKSEQENIVQKVFDKLKAKLFFL